MAKKIPVIAGTMLAAFVFTFAFLFFSGAADFENTEITENAESSPAKSMEQLYEENGLPVRVRELLGEDFSVYLKYPTTLDAQSESTAYAALSDVVRKVSVKAGDKVTRDQVLVSFSENNRNYQQAKLTYENTGVAYTRARKLYDAGYISRADFDNVTMQYKSAKAAYDAMHDTVFVKAPIAGTIIQVNVRQSENVNPGTPLFTISNQRGLVTTFYVGIEEIDLIKTGARVFVSGVKTPLEGRVSDVSFLMDSKKHAFPVTAVFDISAPQFFTGVSVDVAVETYHNENALVVNRKELVRKNDGTYSAFITEDRVGNSTTHAKLIDVELGETRGLDFEVTGGLKEGDLLVLDDVNNLKDNVLINVIPDSVMSHNTEIASAK